MTFENSENSSTEKLLIQGQFGELLFVPFKAFLNVFLVSQNANHDFC